MIGYLRGTVAGKDDKSLLLDVQGVGYDVRMHERALREAPSEGEALALHIHTQVREDAITLFGFAAASDKRLFLLLTKISGVGAGAALAVLSAVEPRELAAAALSGDTKTFSKAQGVGPKLAGRMANELKNMPEIQALFAGAPEAVSAGGVPSRTATAPDAATPAASGAAAEATAALVSLGYSRADAFRAVSAASAGNTNAPAETLIAAALKAV